MTSREVPKKVHFYDNAENASNIVGSAVQTIVIPGKSMGGPTELSSEIVTVFLDYEKRGLHTVLEARQRGDFYTSVAKVCRGVVVTNSEIRQEAVSLWGEEHVLSAVSAGGSDVVSVCSSLPTPAALTWRRRVRNTVRDLPGVGKILKKIRS